MESGASTVVVVPCYNEAERLPVRTFREFVDRHADVALVFVDDGSTDATRSRLEHLSREDPRRFRVLALDGNRGKAAAVRAGMLEAFSSGATYAGYWDADLSTPLDELPRFVEILERDPERLIVLGSRVQLLGRAIEREPHRHYAGRVFATCASVVLGLAVYDTQCGAKLLRVCDESRALFEEPFATNWSFDVELLARFRAMHLRSSAAELGRSLSELPLLRWQHVGSSKVRARHFAVALWELLRIARLYRPRRGPRA